MSTYRRNDAGAVAAAGCLLFIVLFLLSITITTALVFVGWNVGLENSGLVDNEIGWWTAMGIAFLVNIVRSIFSRPIIHQGDRS